MAKVSEDKYAEECSKLANERFGLQRGMIMVMEGFNCNEDMKCHIVKLAQDRNFEGLESALSMIGGDKPHHVRIDIK